MWTVIAVLLAGAVLLAYLVGQKGAQSGPEEDEPTASTTSSVAVAPQPLPIQGAQDFDPPPGSGDENPELAELAVDGDPTTAWETLRYDNDPRLGGIKEGVGLILDLGQAREIRRVTATLQGEGTNLELRVAPESAATAPSGSADDYRLLDEAADVGTTISFDLEQPVRTRYVLLWLTKLPPETSATFRGRVADVEIRG
jgi:putative peptidoglycan lipid II flippase